tara:strand:+ start:28 stop:720 length:693 start_codon:yes stop_codon:yes gene_type:complete
MIEVTYQDHMGDDLATVNAARVSFGKTSKLVCTNLVLGLYDLAKGDRNLISFLAREKHFSPFGHSYAKFHVKAPIFVARQLVKHKFLRWNEISRRYVDDEPEFYEPDVWRGRSADKKQGSEGVIDLNTLPAYDYLSEGTMQDLLEENVFDIVAYYRAMIRHGVAPEQARMVLPQSTMTEWIWSGSLDAFAAMCRLRCAKDTQAETRIVADQISNEMMKIFPVSWKALLDE